MEDCRSDPVDDHLGVVQRYHSDGSLRRGPALVDRRAWTSRRGDLSGFGQGARDLDDILVAAVVGSPAPAYGGKRRQALARWPLAGACSGWLARQRAADRGKREGFLCSEFRQEPHGPVPPQEAAKGKRVRRKAKVAQPVKPQIWVTLLWHMG